MELFSDYEKENNIKTTNIVFSKQQILDIAVSEFLLGGYIFKDLKLFQCMQQLNELSQMNGNNLLYNYLGYEIADTYHKHRHIGYAINMQSPISSFHVEKNIRKVLSLAMEAGGKLSYRKYSMFDMVNGTQQCANFRPAFAKYIYDKYCHAQSKVLDMSTGYGGRLVGFLASHALEYVGVDPNTATHRANEKIKIDLGSHKNICLLNTQAELFPVEQYLNYFDFAFTSPPYFKKEIYTTEATNSCNAYVEYEEWKNNFLYEMIRRTFLSLKDKSYFILNIEDIKISGKLYTLVEDAIAIAIAIGFKFEGSEIFPIKTSQKLYNHESGRGENMLKFIK